MNTDMHIVHVHGSQTTSERAAIVFGKQIVADEDTPDEDCELNESAALIATTIYDNVPFEVWRLTLDHMLRLEALHQGRTWASVTSLNAIAG